MPTEPGQHADRPVLVADGISKSFGSLRVLDGVSLSARRSDVITMIGASGSGKSTFLRCLNLLERPDRGSIVCGDQKMLISNAVPSAATLAPFRARMGMVFQSFNLWPHLTALENVALPPRHVRGKSMRESRDIATHYLSRVGLAERASLYPGMLSGGQQQRVAIARALAMEPDVLLLDEPTSALDPELVQEVLSTMRSLAEEGRTMVLVTHEMAFAREVSTEILFLHAGRIEEKGPPGVVFGRPESPRCRAFLSSIIRH